MKFSLISVFTTLEVSLVGFVQLQVHAIAEVDNFDRKRMIRKFVYYFFFEDVLKDHSSVFGQIETIFAEERDETQEEVLILSTK